MGGLSSEDLYRLANAIANQWTNIALYCDVNPQLIIGHDSNHFYALELMETLRKTNFEGNKFVDALHQANLGLKYNSSLQGLYLQGYLFE